MKRKTIYKTPPDFKCPCCGKECKIIPLNNAFDYAGTHCTHGQSGTHYPSDYGSPVTDCCEDPVPDAEIDDGADYF